MRKTRGREPDLAQATWRVHLQPEALAPVLRVRGGQFFSYESPPVTGAAGGPRPRGDGPVIAAPANVSVARESVQRLSERVAHLRVEIDEPCAAQRGSTPSKTRSCPFTVSLIARAFLAVHVVAIRPQSTRVTVFADFAKLRPLPRKFQLPEASKF